MILTPFPETDPGQWPSCCRAGEKRRGSFQHSGKRRGRTDPICRGGGRFPRALPWPFRGSRGGGFGREHSEHREDPEHHQDVEHRRNLLSCRNPAISRPRLRQLINQVRVKAVILVYEIKGRGPAEHRQKYSKTLIVNVFCGTVSYRNRVVQVSVRASKPRTAVLESDRAEGPHFSPSHITTERQIWLGSRERKLPRKSLT